MADQDQKLGKPRRKRRKVQPDQPLAVVGVGVCVDSLHSLEELFAALGADLGAAYVVAVRQLEGLSVETVVDSLTRRGALPVKVAEDGEALQPNRIYVGGPNDMLTLEEGAFRTRPATEPVGHRGTVDTLLISLAEQAHDRAVAVILSGLGGDGTAGITATKKFGGLSIAEAAPGQEETEAQGAAGPRGIVDLLLPIGKIAREIARYVANLAVADETGSDELPEKYDREIAQVATILRNTTGNDFHGYKRNTFFRRIQRRMQVLQISEIPDYVGRLRGDREEVQHLFQDLLIGVTQFFRDPHEFEVLEREIPRLFEGKGPGDQFRVWVLGCATGEEAYSLAMLLREHMAEMDSPPHVQVFATDLDARALTAARAGRYADSIAEHVRPDRLARWFVKEGDTYCVAKELREMCIFSPHNIVKDAPFSRIDLLSCRNLLIYLNSDLQSRVIPIFHFSLRPGGVLFLGSSENVTRHQKLFAPVDRKNRIFRRLETATRILPDFPLSPRVRAVEPADAPPPPAPRGGPLSGTVSRRAEAIADRYAPAYVVVDDQYDVLHFSGRTGRYLEPNPGAATLNLLNLVHRDLRLDLRSAMHRAAHDLIRVETQTIPILRDGLAFGVNLIVEPVGANDHHALVVLFQDSGPVAEAAPENGERLVSDEHVGRLEAELRLTKERLQATIEELESTNEELKSSNEEYQSINEELQSANEELETSKEELQSVNEELQTVNSELAHRVSELGRSNSDLKNLLESTRIATLFLDNDLRVRNFTPATTDIFHLLETDIGRPIGHVASRIAYPELEEDVRRVLKSLAPVEKEVAGPDDSHFVVRVLPYRSIDNFIAGAVVTFLDVTVAVEAKELQKTLLAELQHRVRNILAVIRSMVRRTHEEGQTAEEFIQHLEGRLGALARTQVLLTRAVDAGVDLDTLIRGELLAHPAGKDQVRIAGPDVELPAKAAEVLTLAIHELTTNSVKYGALITPEARIDIDWEIQGGRGGPRLSLRWSESGVRMVQAAPLREGFGTELITRRVAYELRGTGTLQMRPGGILCTLDFPLLDRSSILQTGDGGGGSRP
ncbi:MAG TPA: CheR family methyltransferase [Allosphingosinicella sp.]|nr:CheR family methyltransferase [Allosphingosinicella sp.]